MNTKLVTFCQMGGYAEYVWLAFAAMLLCFFGLLIGYFMKRRQIRRELMEYMNEH